MAKVHFPGRCVSGFSLLQKFFFFNFTGKFFHGFHDELYYILGYFVHFKTIIQFCETISYGFLSAVHGIATFFRFTLFFFSRSTVPLLSLWHPFCSSRNRPWHKNEWLIYSLICAFKLYLIKGRHIIGGEVSYLDGFLDSFSLRHPFRYICFFETFAQL